jgi:hypothetical protein
LVHSISRDELERHGKSASYVARALNERFAGATVFSDAPLFDGRWVDRLYQQVGINRLWQLADTDRAFAFVEPKDRLALKIALLGEPPHRADADAAIYANAYLQIRSRQAAIASA